MTDRRKLLENPYRPGAGYRPPHLAGRSVQQDHFRRLLRQGFSTENILVTGLRGMGKTVFLDSLRQISGEERWLWVGNDLSESSSLSEERLTLRILTDIAQAFSEVFGGAHGESNADRKEQQEHADNSYTFEVLRAIYERSPGLPSDKLKAVLSKLGSLVTKARLAGIVFAYDEAQCLSDHADSKEFPMSMLIETIASLQRRDGIAPYVLVLSGLPQVFDALTETRAYTERMFHVMNLERLSREETLAAITTPLKPLMPPLVVSKELITKAADLTGGYPYLIQFIGKELIDQLLENGGVLSAQNFPAPEMLDRLDAGLFASRWNRTSDRQRTFLQFIATAHLRDSADFSAHEIVQAGAEAQGFTNAQANQMLQGLCDRGLLYRTRHGRYAFTVPMSEIMIQRRMRRVQDVEESWAVVTDVKPVVGADANIQANGQRRSRGWSWFK